MWNKVSLRSSFDLSNFVFKIASNKICMNSRGDLNPQLHHVNDNLASPRSSTKLQDFSRDFKRPIQQTADRLKAIATNFVKIEYDGLFYEEAFIEKS